MADTVFGDTLPSGILAGFVCDNYRIQLASIWKNGEI